MFLNNFSNFFWKGMEMMRRFFTMQRYQMKINKTGIHQKNLDITQK